MGRDRIFIDSSVLIAAVLSQGGGSFYLLNKLRDTFEFQINEYVFEEVTEVFNKKFADREDLKSRLFLILGWSKIKILPNPPKERVESIAKLVNKEDAPILATALHHSAYLITLDNDFLSEAVVAFAGKENLIISKPKEFIESVRVK